MKGIAVLAVLAVIASGSNVKVAAQAWNQPIPEPATESTAQSIKLANQLNRVGARFLGPIGTPLAKSR